VPAARALKEKRDGQVPLPEKRGKTDRRQQGADTSGKREMSLGGRFLPIAHKKGSVPHPTKKERSFSGKRTGHSEGQRRKTPLSDQGKSRLSLAGKRKTSPFYFSGKQVGRKVVRIDIAIEEEKGGGGGEGGAEGEKVR